jgi:hypothetical protein
MAAKMMQLKTEVGSSNQQKFTMDLGEIRNQLTEVSKSLNERPTMELIVSI